MALRTAEDVFIDYCGRRRGILRAITTEVEAFHSKCSPDQKNLCLYGYNDGTWEVTLPCEEVPPEIPEPAIGINFARDGMQQSDWLSLVAVHSDSWLMAVAFYNAARLDAEGRRQLFNDINSLPTCYEIISGRADANPKPPGAAVQVSRRPVGHPGGPPQVKRPRPAAAGGGSGGYGGVTSYGSDEEEEEEDQVPDAAGGGYGGGSEPCPNCGRKYVSGEFWIACDFCDRWFDGRCVNMTPQKAERSSEWKCPFCINARA